MARKKAKNSELNERIKTMEEAFDRTLAVTAALKEALDAFEANQETLESLASYMESGLWKKDFEADEEGILAAGLKRGVLSEDGLYNLLEEVAELRERMKTV